MSLPKERGWEPVFFSERYQGAGLAKNVPADTVLVGTSMAANYRASEIAETFGGTAVRVTIPDGYLSEFDKVMDVAFRNQTPERVVFILDLNILVRDESGVTDAMPEYLYNDNILDDAKYLLNKDVLMRCGYTLVKQRTGETQPLQDAFVWDGNVFFSKTLALAGYDRPETSEKAVPADAFLENGRANLATVTNWLEQHPDTEFIFYFSPYSILFWDKMDRQGETEAMLTLLEEATERM